MKANSHRVVLATASGTYSAPLQNLDNMTPVIESNPTITYGQNIDINSDSLALTSIYQTGVGPINGVHIFSLDGNNNWFHKQVIFQAHDWDPNFVPSDTADLYSFKFPTENILRDRDINNIALTEDGTLWIGSENRIHQESGSIGVVHQYRLYNDQYTYQKTLIHQNANQVSPGFGSAIAATNEDLVIGAPYRKSLVNINGNNVNAPPLYEIANTGAVYTYGELDDVYVNTGGLTFEGNDLPPISNIHFGFFTRSSGTYIWDNLYFLDTQPSPFQSYDFSINALFPERDRFSLSGTGITKMDGNYFIYKDGPETILYNRDQKFSIRSPQ